MSINPDPNRLNLAEQNCEYTMAAVAKVAIWIESHLSFPGEPPAQTVDLDELFEGKLPAPATMPRLKREPDSNMALQRLVANFELTDTEVLILLATVATELINGFARTGKGDESQGNTHTPSNDGVSHDIKGDRLWQEPSIKSEKSANTECVTRQAPEFNSGEPRDQTSNRNRKDPFSQPRNLNPTPERDYSKMSPQEILDSTAPYLRNNDRSSACSILRNALAYYPNHSGLNFWLGKTACEGQLNYTEALTALERAERGNGQWLNNPESEKANWYWQATVLLAMPEDNPEQASDLCLKYLKALPQGIYATKARQKHNEARKRIAYKKLGGGG